MTSKKTDPSAKRAHAAGSNLEYLKQIFSQNPNPAIEDRLKISRKTRIPEKSVRIWFQNYRAKMRRIAVEDGSDAPHKVPLLRLPNALSTEGITCDIDELYVNIDVTYVHAREWTRARLGFRSPLRTPSDHLSPLAILSALGTSNLLVLLSRCDPEINYFFLPDDCSGVVFRIFYPVSTIIGCRLVHHGRADSHLEIMLGQAPKFAAHYSNQAEDFWQVCADFSDGKQMGSAHFGVGGAAIPHVLQGPAESLERLRAYLTKSDESVHSTPLQYSPPMDSWNDKSNALPEAVLESWNNDQDAMKRGDSLEEKAGALCLGLQNCTPEQFFSLDSTAPVSESVFPDWREFLTTPTNMPPTDHYPLGNLLDQSEGRLPCAHSRTQSAPILESQSFGNLQSPSTSLPKIPTHDTSYILGQSELAQPIDPNPLIFFDESTQGGIQSDFISTPLSTTEPCDLPCDTRRSSSEISLRRDRSTVIEEEFDVRSADAFAENRRQNPVNHRAEGYGIHRAPFDDHSNIFDFDPMTMDMTI